MIIRKATISDLKSICEAHKHCFPNNFSTHLTRGKELLSRYYEEYLKTESEMFFVAICDKKLIGFCMGYKRENNTHESAFLKKNRFLLFLNVLLGLIRFDKKVWSKVIKREKKEDFIIVNKSFSDDIKNDKCDLLSICVLPDFRKKGIASTLLSSFEGAVVSLKRRYSQLSVEKNNLLAIKFYEKNGYRIFAESTKSIKMFKELVAE